MSSVTHLCSIACLTLSATIGALARAEESIPEEVIIATKGVIGGGVVVPSPDDIIAMQASVYNSPLKLKNVDVFDVPSKYYSEVMAMFLEGTSAEHQPASVVREVGILRIQTKNGIVRHITWMWTGGKTPLKFSLMGIRCARKPEKWQQADDAMGLELLVRDIYRSVTGVDTFSPPSGK